MKGEDLDALLRAHPLEGTWSALEYACHIRDVFQVQRDRIARARVEDGFTPEPMRRDERVEEMQYNAQDPDAVIADLGTNADALAADIEGFSDADWDRTMTYLYPEKATRSLTWVVQHTAHEAEHHLLDVGRVLRAARGR